MRNEHIINMSDDGVQTSGNGVNPRGFTPEEVNEIKKKEDLKRKSNYKTKKNRM